MALIKKVIDNKREFQGRRIHAQFRSKETADNGLSFLYNKICGGEEK
jgi:hypothetical protein